MRRLPGRGVRPGQALTCKKLEVIWRPPNDGQSIGGGMTGQEDQSVDASLGSGLRWQPTAKPATRRNRPVDIERSGSFRPGLSLTPGRFARPDWRDRCRVAGITKVDGSHAVVGHPLCVIVGDDAALTAMLVWSLPMDQIDDYRIFGPAAPAHPGRGRCAGLLTCDGEVLHPNALQRRRRDIQIATLIPWALGRVVVRRGRWSTVKLEWLAGEER